MAKTQHSKVRQNIDDEMSQICAIILDFYVSDLESKLEAFRGRELALADESERARLLAGMLQRENAALLDREREMTAVQVGNLL